MATLIMGILGFTFVVNEVLVIILSTVNNPEMALFFHRVEAISALFFCFTLPMLLSDILELGNKIRSFNTFLYKTLLLITLVISIIIVINPELFLSPAKPAGVLITPWNAGRGTPGILYRLRDIMIFSAAIYTFILISIDIMYNRRVRYLGLLLFGIVAGIISGTADIVHGLIEVDKGLFSSRIFSFFGLGFTTFILLSMISVFQWFLDQTHNIDNAKKIKSLGLFAGGIAHDFNNILTRILGNTTLLMNIPQIDKEVKEILMDIEKAVYRSKTLTMQLLTFSRGGTPVKDITSIKNIVEETALFVLSGSGIKPRISCDEHLDHAEVDAGQISQVIQNLVLNARDAMHDRGSFIDIKMENVKILPAFIKNAQLSNFIKIEIKDYGEGIKDKILPYIFDPYFTTKGFGTGLGLSVCHSIIVKHGGDITVKSKEGEGTTFTILLPATHKKEYLKSQPLNINIHLSGKILFMDDDPHLRPMLKKMLEHIGFSAICVPDGDTAISEFINARNSDIPFAAVIMDLTISGGMGGVEAARKIREIDQSIPLIVASGYSDDPVISNYESYGFNQRLIKPFSLDELRKTIASILKSADSTI